MKWLILIVLISAVLRLGALAQRPAGFTWDEAALGYTSYSLLLTGRDEYAKPLPLVLKSFGDYKPAAYAYLAVPVIKVFGLNEFATRLPSAMAGILMVGLIYVLAATLFGTKPALFAALTLAINPWAIHFSRGAWEANVAMLLSLLGATLWVKKRYVLSALFLGLTFWTYQGAKLFTPLLILALVVIYSSEFKLKTILKPAVIILLMILPLIWSWSSQSGRLKVLSIFAYQRPSTEIAEILRQDQATEKNWLYYLFHSETYDRVRGIALRYSNHFSPAYLFFTGDWTNGRHATPYYGYFHLPEALLLVIGSYLLLRSGGRKSLIVWGWLFFAALPAALSRDIVSGVRALPMVVPLSLLIGLGWVRISKNILVTAVFGVAMLFFLSYFGDLYLTHSPFFTSADWLVAYKPAWQIVKDNENQYQHVVFSDKLGQPYIFGLFYLKVDPAEYQSQAKLVENAQGDVGQVTGFGKYEFRPLFWPADRGLANTLFVGGEYELPEKDLEGIPNLVRLGEVNYSNNTVGLRIVGIK